MPESIGEKFQRHCSLIAYAFSPSNIKDVCIRMTTTYETPKIISIDSLPIAITCRIVQLLILLYAFVYILWYKRGYQERDTSLLSSVILEANGIGVYAHNPSMTLDNADYIVPSKEHNALFVMTNYIETEQQRGLCAESPDIHDSGCTTDVQCKLKGRNRVIWNGRWTGRCRRPEQRCEMESWCPVENDTIIFEPINDTLNYTVLLRNFIEFPRFNVTRRNILNGSSYYQTCRYHPVHDQLCPTFRIGDVLNIVESDDEERQRMLTYGAVLRIKIDWMCNLDLGERECKPRYSFGRLDSRWHDEKFSFGFNFRYATSWTMNNITYRRLRKAFGLRFIVAVNGDAGKFSLLVLTLNIGSIIGILGLATVICDIVALYFSEEGYIYRRQKYQSVHLKTKSVNSIVTIPSTVHKRQMARKVKRRK